MQRKIFLSELSQTEIQLSLHVWNCHCYHHSAHVGRIEHQSQEPPGRLEGRILPTKLIYVFSSHRPCLVSLKNASVNDLFFSFTVFIVIVPHCQQQLYTYMSEEHMRIDLIILFIKRKRRIFSQDNQAFFSCKLSQNISITRKQFQGIMQLHYTGDRSAFLFSAEFWKSQCATKGVSQQDSKTKKGF